MKVVSFLNECTNLTVSPFMIMAAMDPQESWGVQGLKFAQVAIRGISQALLGRVSAAVIPRRVRAGAWTSRPTTGPPVSQGRRGQPWPVRTGRGCRTTLASEDRTVKLAGIGSAAVSQRRLYCH